MPRRHRKQRCVLEITSPFAKFKQKAPWHGGVLAMAALIADGSLNRWYLWALRRFYVLY